MRIGVDINSLYNEIKYEASSLSYAAGFCRDMSVKERAGGDVQNESNFHLKQFEGFFLKNEDRKENDCLSSGNGQPGDDYNCIDVANQETDEIYRSNEKHESSSPPWLQ